MKKKIEGFEFTSIYFTPKNIQLFNHSFAANLHQEGT